MSEEIKKNEQPQVEEQPKEQEAQKPAPITLSMISKGTLELAVPIRARSADVSVLHYDFTKLSGWEYVEAMDSDTASRNVFQVSKKQALALFAAAAAKQAPTMRKTSKRGSASLMRSVRFRWLRFFWYGRHRRPGRIHTANN